MWKVRSFERDIPLEDSTIRVRGIVMNQGYILAVDSVGIEVKIGASEFGKDERGEYAVLESGEWFGCNGSVVKIEPSSEEPYPGTNFTPSGLKLSVMMPSSDKTVQAHEETCCRANIDLNKVNLFVPNGWSSSIYYNCVGNADGVASCDLEKLI